MDRERRARLLASSLLERGRAAARKAQDEYNDEAPFSLALKQRFERRTQRLRLLRLRGAHRRGAHHLLCAAGGAASLQRPRQGFWPASFWRRLSLTAPFLYKQKQARNGGIFPHSGIGRSKKVPSATPDVFRALSCVGGSFLVRFDFFLKIFCFLFSGRKQKTRNQPNKKRTTNTKKFEISVFICANPRRNRPAP